MKRLLFFTVCVFSCLMMTAGNITKQQAEAIARTFLGKHRPAVVNQQVRMTQKKAMPRSGASDVWTPELLDS